MTSGLMKTCGSVRIVFLGEVHGDHALAPRPSGWRRARCRAPRTWSRTCPRPACAAACRTSSRRLGYQPQPLVRENDDVAQSHAPRCKGWELRGQFSFPLEPTGSYRPTVRSSFAARRPPNRRLKACAHVRNPRLLVLALIIAVGVCRHHRRCCCCARAAPASAPGAPSSGCANSMRGSTPWAVGCRTRTPSCSRP